MFAPSLHPLSPGLNIARRWVEQGLTTVLGHRTIHTDHCCHIDLPQGYLPFAIMTPIYKGETHLKDA
jgi:hypothetical protein